MNEEDLRRFEYLYPLYIASLNENSSATAGTSNFIEPEFNDGEEAFQYYSFYKSESSWNWEEEDPWYNHNSSDDYSWKPEYNYNPLYEWSCEEEDAWFSHNSQHLYNRFLNDTIVELQASMVKNCEMMKDLLAEFKQIKQELSKLSGHLVRVTSTTSGENFEESTLPSINEGYHTDVVSTLFMEENDTTTIQKETLSHSTLFPLILDEKKCYHTDVIDKVVEEIRKLFSPSHLHYFLYDLDNDHFLFPENVTNASIFETQDKRKFIFDTG
ncbi:hypothetical protein CsatA_003998 [Cannabis sativa]